MTSSQASFRFPETFEHPVCARHGASCWANTGEQDESLPLGASLPCRWCAWHILGAPSLHGTSPSRSRRRSPVSRATEAAAAESRPITSTGRGCFARGPSRRLLGGTTKNPGDAGPGDPGIRKVSVLLYPSGPKEADADGNCLPWRQVLPWTPAGAFQGSPRPCHITRTF